LNGDLWDLNMEIEVRAELVEKLKLKEVLEIMAI
jgi:hypothetical protein